MASNKNKQMSRYARLSYVWVHLLLLPGLALGLTIRHFINAMLLLLVIWSIGYCLLRLLQRFVLHGNDPIFTNLGWPKLVYCIFLAFAAYALYSFTLFLLSDDPDVQNKYEMYFILMIPLYVFFLHVRVHLAYICHALIFSSLAVGIHAAYQVFYLHYGRAFGAHYPIGFGDLALVLAILALLILPHYSRLWQKLLCILASMSAYMACFLSGSRGAWIAIPVLLLLIIWIYRRELRFSNPAWVQYKDAIWRKNMRYFWLPLLLLLVIGISIGISQKERISQRWLEVHHELELYKQNQIKPESVILRLEMWRISWHIFKEHPWFGAGYHSFQQKTHEFYQEQHAVMATMPDVTQRTILRFGNSHNQYMNDLSTKGLIGLLLLLSIFILPCFWFYRHTSNQNQRVRTVAYCGITVILAFTVFGLTETVFHRNFLIIYYLLFVTLCMALLQKFSSATKEMHMKPI